VLENIPGKYQEFVRISLDSIVERVSVDGVRKRCQMFPLQGQQFNPLNSIYLPPGTYSFIK
jgi:hypothetical protein